MVSLARNGRFAMAGWYLLATVVVPIVCVALGWMVGSGGALNRTPVFGVLCFPRLNFTHRWMNRIVRRSVQR